METRNSKFEIRNYRTAGSVLLVVLFVIMAITVLSLGFLTRSDAELACGQNMSMRIQMDQLADSGLQHAKGLILNPQDIDISSGSWSATAQQLVADTNDYYDVAITRDDSDANDQCNYTIDCNAYRLSSGEQTARSDLSAEMRLDPCIALWVGAGTTTTLWNELTVYGDVYCADGLINQGRIYGDVFAGSLTGAGTKTGQLNSQTLSLTWPDITVQDFLSRCTEHYTGDYVLTGNAHINGMLLVEGSLTVRGTDNVIDAGKNLPALYVTGDLIVEQSASLSITGLAVVDNRVLIYGNAGLNVLGGLFTRGVFAETVVDSSGNGNSGTLYNGPIRSIDGGHSALIFDGVNDYAQTANSSTKLQLTGNYTISVWIKPNSVQNSWAGIVSRTNSSGTLNHWTLQFNSSIPRKLIIHHLSASWDTGITINDLVAGGTWHHVAVVRSGTAIKSYFDGTERSTSDPTYNPSSGLGHLNIGADRTASSSYVYSGLIDDVRIYNRALDVNEISSPPDDLNLIGHWRFDENAPNVTITAEPAKSAITVGPQGARQRWGQAAGAFFRSISRR